MTLGESSAVFSETTVALHNYFVDSFYIVALFACMETVWSVSAKAQSTYQGTLQRCATLPHSLKLVFT